MVEYSDYQGEGSRMRKLMSTSGSACVCGVSWALA